MTRIGLLDQPNECSLYGTHCTGIIILFFSYVTLPHLFTCADQNCSLYNAGFFLATICVGCYEHLQKKKHVLEYLSLIVAPHC